MQATNKTLVSCWCMLIIVVLIRTENATAECPDPDKYPLDYAERVERSHSYISPPPSCIDSLRVNSIGSFSASVVWKMSQNLTDASDNVVPICHFRLRFSYKSPQRGQLQRNFHLDINGSHLVADIPQELTPNTSVRLQVFTCYFYVSPSEIQPDYICSHPKNLTFTTLPITQCPHDEYLDNVACSPCACNGKSDICITETGYCVDCLDNSDGVQCERCLNDYGLNNETNVCERQVKPSDITTGLPFSLTSPVSTGPASTGVASTSTPPFPTTPRLDARTTLAAVTQTNPSTPGSSTAQNATLQHTTSPLPTAAATESPRKIYQSLTVITAICSVIGIVVILLLIIIIYRRIKLKGKTPVHFWTIQLQGENESSVAFQDIPESTFNREDNSLIENDFTIVAHNNRDKLSSFASDENPYQQLTA